MVSSFEIVCLCSLLLLDSSLARKADAASRNACPTLFRLSLSLISTLSKSKVFSVRYVTQLIHDKMKARNQLDELRRKRKEAILVRVVKISFIYVLIQPSIVVMKRTKQHRSIRRERPAVGLSTYPTLLIFLVSGNILRLS